MTKCRTKYDDYFYTIPNSKLLTMMIIVAICMVTIFITLFRYMLQCAGFNDCTNNMVGNYLTMVGLPVGVILSFIIANAWTNFSDAQNKENEEATKLLNLYDLLDSIEGAQPIREQIKEYTEYIIEEEFDRMAMGEQPQEGLDMLFAIGDSIQRLNPESNQQTALFSQALDMYRNIVELRIVRMNHVSQGLAPELWWVLVLGVVVMLVMSMFLYCQSFLLHLVMIWMAAGLLVSLLFLIIALNYPYRGDFGLDSVPFQLSLNNMN